MVLFVFILIFIGVIVSAIIQSNQKKEEEKQRKEKITKAFQTLTDFTPTKQYVGINNTFILAFDKERRKFFFTKGGLAKTYDYEDIISVKKIENGTVRSTKSTTRTIGGALVGGAVAGGVGAIVGGLSGDTAQKGSHSSIKVKVLLRQNDNTSIEIPCFDCKVMSATGKPIEDESSEAYIYKRAAYQANQIVDYFSVIIDETDNKANCADATEDATTNVSVSMNRLSIADELSKLADLREKGILSEEEFQAQKSRLLNL